MSLNLPKVLYGVTVEGVLAERKVELLEESRVQRKRLVEQGQSM